MPREFVPYDRKEIDAEFLGLESASESDSAKLDFCMQRYEECGFENPHPAVIKSFDEGLREIRHFKDDYAGRCLFFESPRKRASKGKGA